MIAVLLACRPPGMPSWVASVAVQLVAGTVMLAVQGQGFAQRLHGLLIRTSCAPYSPYLRRVCEVSFTSKSS